MSFGDIIDSVLNYLVALRLLLISLLVSRENKEQATTLPLPVTSGSATDHAARRPRASRYSPMPTWARSAMKQKLTRPPSRPLEPNCLRNALDSVADSTSTYANNPPDNNNNVSKKSNTRLVKAHEPYRSDSPQHDECPTQGNVVPSSYPQEYYASPPQSPTSSDSSDTSSVASTSPPDTPKDIYEFPSPIIVTDFSNDEAAVNIITEHEVLGMIVPTSSSASVIASSYIKREPESPSPSNVPNIPARKPRRTDSTVVPLCWREEHGRLAPPKNTFINPAHLESKRARNNKRKEHQGLRPLMLPGMVARREPLTAADVERWIDMMCANGPQAIEDLTTDDRSSEWDELDFIDSYMV